MSIKYILKNKRTGAVICLNCPFTSDQYDILEIIEDKPKEVKKPRRRQKKAENGGVKDE